MDKVDMCIMFIMILIQMCINAFSLVKIVDIECKLNRIMKSSKENEYYLKEIDYAMVDILKDGLGVEELR